jgi:hypothetical protein
VYPRATQAGFGPDGLNNGGLVIELVTDDSFDRVSGWYRAKMPPGSERRDCGGRPMPVTPHMPRDALFSVGKLGTDYRAAWILEMPKDEPNTRAQGWPKGKPLPNTIVMLKVC